ncbi:16S rRNA (cytosine(1402)-N(4))-methyltransferase RsmH [Nitrospirales bacterium NOB]|nr:16S rRNA (cytosine(1402)-N(4))-methyltransferase RsmH [Nitrospira sp. NTP2]MDL1889422.1 16S rRNA (cytosine(1402)-N(4))-methyltransferase RsmH [Nitrospirales bacterium NOB]QOJ37149.1 MAG: 16S rRNA (cytosine(1402)-N(4))-methyltransferase RsmH [Nitrospira sp.]RIK59857.1 MAG: 16S rRNA (cytosine(1402)-N(4))-methyltransferase [Nitrospira sp.]
MHVPVLVDEIIAALGCRPNGVFVDCTIGYAGLAMRLLERTVPDGILVGIDRDEAALASARIRLRDFLPRVRLWHGNFSDLKRCVAESGVHEVHGIVFDLGVSSPQIDRAERGFSFREDGPLDMRMDQGQGRTAADLVRELSEAALADLIYQLGEERYARRIARAIVQARVEGDIRTTRALASVVERAVPVSYRHGRIHCATRTFQALRIAVNGELDVLEPALRDAVDILMPGGRVCVVSFHSLEDRIVKHTFRSLAASPEGCFRIVSKKPIVASEQERCRNPRSRSAKLRVGERLAKEGVR